MKIYLLILMQAIIIHLKAHPEITIHGPFHSNDSFTKVGLGIFECLRDHAQVRLKAVQKITEPYPNYIINALIEGDRAHQPNIYIYTNSLLTFNPESFQKNIPLSENVIKFCYSMFEGSNIPLAWVRNINENFDGVIVPDVYVKEVYLNSGVIKPIFIIPCVCDIEQYLGNPLRSLPHEPFTFGSAGSFIDRKNFIKLLTAFVDEFGDDPRVQLVLQNRTSWGITKVKNTLSKIIETRQIKNVKIIDQFLSDADHIKLLCSFDAYVFISKGEGFSFTPREALSAGIPCILTNNTAQKTICNSGCVYAIEANLAEPALFELLKGEDCGKIFDCNQQDVQFALRHVFHNYSTLYAQKARGREWVKQYSKDSLRGRYLSLVNPKQIILGDYNEASDEYLMTNDQKLYEKYLSRQALSK